VKDGHEADSEGEGKNKVTKITVCQVIFKKLSAMLCSCTDNGSWFTGYQNQSLLHLHSCNIS